MKNERTDSRIVILSPIPQIWEATHAFARSYCWVREEGKAKDPRRQRYHTRLQRCEELEGADYEKLQALFCARMSVSGHLLPSCAVPSDGSLSPDSFRARRMLRQNRANYGLMHRRQKAPSFDHLVGGQHETGRHAEAERAQILRRYAHVRGFGATLIYYALIHYTPTLRLRRHSAGVFTGGRCGGLRGAGGGHPVRYRASE